MSTAMLTALNATTGLVLDVTALAVEERDAIHGARTARTNGYDIVCRQCHRPSHLVLNHKGNAFFRHNPGETSACILSEFGRRESTEHLAAKIAIIEAHRALKGWTAEAERRFEVGGELVVVDVFASPEDPDEFRVPTSWEVQVSPQPHGVTVERTNQRRRVTGTRTAWVTPHETTLGRNLGLITDPKVLHVVKGLYETSELLDPLPNMPVGEFIRATQGKRRRLIWTDAGLGGEWVAYQPGGEALPTTKPRSRPAKKTMEDRACVRLKGTNTPAIKVERGRFTIAGARPAGDQACKVCSLRYSEHTGHTCAICGQAVEHHGADLPGDFQACIEGQARMAKARHRAGVELSEIDRLVMGLA